MEELKLAIRAGLNGYKAMTVQVFALMWLRTIMNYQYKNGGTFIEVLKKLYKEGGIPRFYSGILPALIQGPLSRFGDTFSNAIVLNILSRVNFPIFVKTGIASFTSGLVRIIITPVDCLKTNKQVQGKQAMSLIKAKIKEKGLLSLYDGCIANFLGNLLGHYPWFVVHNYLDNYFPMFNNSILLSLMRNAFIGLCSQIVSDTISNSVRVMKTAMQTGDTKKSYKEIFLEIKKKDGLKGVFFRGLSTRLMINCVQSVTFNVMWKYFGGQKITNKNLKVLPPIKLIDGNKSNNGVIKINI